MCICVHVCAVCCTALHMHRTAPPLALHPLVLLSTWTLVHPASRHLLMLIVQVPLEREREKFNIRQAPIGGKDDYDSENSCISNGLPSSSRRGRGESGERSEVQARSTLTSTAPKARSRSREVATLDGAPRILQRVSSKIPLSASSSSGRTGGLLYSPWQPLFVSRVCCP